MLGAIYGDIIGSWYELYATKNYNFPLNSKSVQMILLWRVSLEVLRKLFTKKSPKILSFSVCKGLT